MALPPSRVRRIPGQTPITPEIAQAYQNDPRTQLARAGIEQGISAAPVAQGQYAWADALARSMNGALGGWQDRRMREQYGKQDEETSAELAAISAQRLAGKMGDAPKAAPQAPAIAAAMGAPPAPPVAPVAPVAPSVAGLPPTPPPPPPPPRMGPETGAPRPRGVVFTDPLAGTGRVTDAFGAARPGGRTHNGRDLAAAAGTPIGAAADGTVVRAWNDTVNGGGNSVRIRHADGSITGYAHMEGFNVRDGDTVRAGQPIGTVGSTGRSSGPHLHFTYRDPSGARVDPARLRFGEPEQAAPEQAPDAEVAELPGADVQGYNNYGIEALERPEAPKFSGPTRSRGLQAADEMAAAGNPYLVARAQERIAAGLDQQTELDEADATRRFETGMTGYRAGLDGYYNDRTEIRRQRYGTGERIAGQRFQTNEREAGQVWTGNQNELNRNFQRDERIGAQDFTALEAERARIAARDNITLQLGSREEIARARALSSPAGIRAQTAASDAIQANANAITDLDAFMALNERQGTGGIRERLPFGANTFGDPELQEMETISSRLTTNLSTLLKGALSDRDIQLVRDGTVNITRGRRANENGAALMRRVLEVANEFNVERVEALSRGDNTFPRSWAAYRQAVPVGADMQTYSEWKASVPSYDAQGNLVR